ncbi:AAA family ATPase [Acidianus ambivalens]|nr:AAA family ATPase [Acidianus ambivalens]
MKIKVTSLGPINEANIDLGDLTVFFGPPNSGKSTALLALYYALNPPLFLPFTTSLKYRFIKAGNGVMNIRGEIKKEGYIEFEYSPSDEYLKQYLPEGEFSVEPFSFIDFMKNYQIYEDYEDYLKFQSIVLPSECDETVSDVLRNGIKFTASIRDNKVSVNYQLGTQNLSEPCKEYVLKEISTNLINKIGERILSKFLESFYEKLNEIEGIKSTLFIPYWRSLATYETLAEGDQLPGFINVALTAIGLSNLPQLFEYFTKLSNKKINEDVYKLLQPLIPGNIEVIGNKLIYKEKGKLIPWKFTSASIMELLSVLLSIKEKEELVLYEEPETQLHEKYQLLISMILYALNNKLVISTHSQTIIYTLSFLTLLKPKAEEVAELFKSLKLSNYEELAKAVEKANSKNVKFYYFHDGIVEEKSAEEISNGIPGISDVMEKEFDWFSKLYHERIREEKNANP